jgi:pimeloyl-ACP methyl ester carboxylesterase
MVDGILTTEIAGYPAMHAVVDGADAPFTVLFLHGIMGHHGQFERYLRFFSARGFDCFAVSRRGRLGVPPEHARGVRIEDYVQDTLRVLEVLGDGVVVVGHSLGGLIAQKVAEAGRCRAAVLVSSAPPRGVGVRPPWSAMPFYASAMPAIVSGRPKLTPYDVVSRVAMGRVPENDRRRIYDAFVPESGLVFRALALGAPVAASAVHCPVLCVGGDSDGVFPPRVLHGIARRYGAEAHEQPEAGHWLLDEPRWEAAASRIADWLGDLPT